MVLRATVAPVCRRMAVGEISVTQGMLSILGIDEQLDEPLDLVRGDLTAATPLVAAHEEVLEGNDTARRENGLAVDEPANGRHA